MNQRSRLLLLQLAIVMAVCSFMFFFGLGAFGLVGADEPRYAQIAREMLARHDWVTPVLNGKPWLEKPVLLYWKMIGSYSVFGVHDWAARIPSAGHATALALAIFFFMRRFRPGAEMNAAFITASSAAMIGFGRGASTDMMLAALFGMAMLAWWTWEQTQKKIWLAGFYALLAAGMLAKGPVAPGLAVLIVGAFAAVRRDGKIFLRSIWWPGMLLFCVIVLPWYIAVQSRVPQFFRIFFVEHNLERFGTNLYQHSQPFWYYIPVFLLGLLPWTIFSVSAIVDDVRAFLREPAEGEEHEADGLPVFLLLWTAIPILFFSISRSKLPGYILPAMPAAMLLTANYLRRSQTALSRWKVLAHALLCGLLAGGALLAPWRLLKAHATQAAIMTIVLTTVIVAFGVLLMVRRSGSRGLGFATLAPVVIALGFLLRPAASVLDLATSARTVDRELTKDGAPQGPIAVFNVKRDVEYGLNFYRNQPIVNYERDGVPAQSHVVIARQGSQDAVQALAGDRNIKPLGSFPPQHLEFFLVSNAK
jgi:4-amino-4-deoxy-L-arabinose transferase-like glycosyltransferase